MSTTPDVPYKEMASHCETLMMGKQQKMSVFMSAQEQNDIFSTGTVEERQTSDVGVQQPPKVLNSIQLLHGVTRILYSIIRDACFPIRSTYSSLLLGSII